MAIRTFRPADEDSVAALWKTVFNYPQPHNEPHRVIRTKLAVQPELFFVAEVEGQVVGTVMGGYDGNRGWIYSVAVSPEARRRGIGSALMRRVEKELRSRGCPKVNLQVQEANAGVVEFYKKLGYAVEPRINLGKVLEAK